MSAGIKIQVTEKGAVFNGISTQTAVKLDKASS